MEKASINGIPLSSFGITLLNDSYKSLIEYPRMKSVNSNDWAEYNGIEPDLENPTLDVRSVTLNFYAKGEYAYNEFMEYLLKYVCNEFYFAEINRYYKLRLDTTKLNEFRLTAQKFALTFIDYWPTYDTERQTHQTSYLHITNRSGFVVDGADMSDFGISVLEGTMTALMETPKTKDRLTINQNSINGAWYDCNTGPKLKSQDVTLKLLIRSADLKSVSADYYDFLNMLTRPGIRRLFLSDTMDEFPFHYVSCSVDNVHEKLNSGCAGIAFNVTICIIERDSKIKRYLVDDTGEMFITDDSQTSFITED